jgi:hypothetical protein
MTRNSSSFEGMPWSSIALLFVVLSLAGAIIYAGIQWPLSSLEVGTIVGGLVGAFGVLFVVHRAEWKRSELGDPDSSWLPWGLRGLLSSFLAMGMFAQALFVFRRGHYVFATLLSFAVAIGFLNAIFWAREGVRRYRSAKRSTKIP